MFIKKTILLEKQYKSLEGLLNKKIFNSKNKILTLIIFQIILLIMCSFFFPFVFTTLVGFILFKRLKKINPNIKVVILLILLLISIIINFFYFVTVFNWNLEYLNLPKELYLTFYWLTESIHFLIFLAFFYCCYRIIRYTITPYSNLYVASYVGTHTIYNGCPITQTQNYLLNMGGGKSADNLFWVGFFQGKTDFARMIFALLCLILFVSAVIQLHRLKLKTPYWYTFWLENKLNKNELEKKYYDT